ncbi:hypothetical protein S7711_04473 [Stachybotrys chartarum IBT 7711]|uniref:Major facilitator superfamily (MFS) profile domain-containing protein n=1 Tax=Stachybotrys chartarum (strain CBS 109288 / IBT 7711) TaxID=1280523 RepID=A0A084BA56_STACB|nr:hypothetical protein S7711_04473 [Stachybotrys chartarum IBT 7711]
MADDQGSTGTFSIAYGVISDIASPAERGTYVNLVSFAITTAPTLGPILGGGLSYAAGWAWIFWFLCIASGTCLVMMIFLLPETSRKTVGNGSIKPPKHLVLPVRGLFRHWEETRDEKEHKQRLPNPLRSLAILSRRDNTTIVLACGLLYVVYTCVNASLSILFIEIYNLNQWQAGLVYLPFGLGGVVSTFFTGQLLDRAYRIARTEQGLAADRVGGDDLDTFDIERARLRVIWIPMLLTCISVAALGWHMAIPLAIQFVAGLCMQMDFSIYNTLLVDKNHHAPAAAQASSNLVRCSMAAITMAFLQDLLVAIGIGWTFTFMAGLCLLAMALFLVDYQWGAAWRQQRLGPTDGD